jgi:pimeloyl-ACP methyl ester carboxylesterase
MVAITAPGFAARAPSAIDALVALAAAQPTPESSFARQMMAILASDRLDRLGSITAPTLVVHGLEDPLVPPANGAAIARAIPGARLVELPGCGHLPMWECPRALADTVLHFLGVAG